MFVTWGYSNCTAKVKVAHVLRFLSEFVAMWCSPHVSMSRIRGNGGSYQIRLTKNFLGQTLKYLAPLPASVT